MQLRRSSRLRIVRCANHDETMGDEVELADFNSGTPEAVQQMPTTGTEPVDVSSTIAADSSKNVTDIRRSEDEVFGVQQPCTVPSDHIDPVNIPRLLCHPSALPGVEEITEEFLKDFEHLIGKQSELFFNRLKSAEYISYGGLEVFKNPADKNHLLRILKQFWELLPEISQSHDTDLTTLLAQLHEDQEQQEKLNILNEGLDAAEFKDPLQTLLDHQTESNELGDAKMIELVTKMHGIDVSNISEILAKPHPQALKRTFGSSQSSRRLDISVISNKYNRLLTKERNTSLAWPSKSTKKLKKSPSMHEDIPLMS